MYSGESDQGLIRTPDRRVRVFVSSTLGELSDERRSVRAGVEQLRLSPVMFEMGARPHPPRALYRSYLAQSDVFVGIYWQRYGWVAPDMAISGLEDEFMLAGEMPRLMYVKRPAPDLEPRLSDMLRRLQAGDAVSYKSFATAEELRTLVIDDLALMLTERFGPVPSTPSVGVPAAAPEPVTSLVGRTKEIADITDLLRSGRRLVSITGAGGVGKTRVAVAVLEAMRQSGTANTAFVDLSGVTDPAAVLVAVAVAAGIREEGRENAGDALVRQLSEGSWLIVIDNFEQVLAAAPELAALLERCPRLQVLVTSRRLLRLRGEIEYQIRPLAVWGSDSDRPAPALALLEDRARAARPDFTIDDRNRAVIADLCRRLDGLPLALELAAPQLRMFSPDQLLARLDGWLTGHTSATAYADLPPRQRTLRATVAWSWEFLDRSAQLLFARLAVFSGPFTIDCASAVCSWGGLDVVVALGSLLDHSLVAPTTRPDGQPGFQMLETIRAQAHARLAEADEEDACFAALERYLITVYEAAAPRLHSAEQPQVARTLDGHLGNLSATLGWLLANGQPLAPLITALGSCWVWGQLRGRIRHLPDVSDRLRKLSSLDHDHQEVDQNGVDHDTDMAALCWLQMGQLTTACRYAEANDLLRYWLPEIRLLGDRLYGMALMVSGLSRPAGTGPGRPARELLDEATTIFRESDYRPGLGYALSHLGDASLLDGQPDAARCAYAESLQISHELGDVNLKADAEFHLAAFAVQVDDGTEAFVHLEIAGRIYLDLVHIDGMARCLAVAAGMALLEGNEHRGTELFGAAEAMRDPLEIRPWPMISVLEAQWRDRLRERLGPAEFADAYRRGRELNGQRELAQLLRLPINE
jgi:predicted ATPase